jgi:hypothetical protein
METKMEQSILYVDIENLQDFAKKAIISAIDRWPEEFPRPGVIKLYVKADQTELWRIWAGYHIASIEVQYKGVQHYTAYGSKNSADLSLSLDALADMLTGRTKYIAVMSDDSDYVSLFAALKQEIGPADNPNILFKWFMTNRPDTRSQMLTDFFPAEYIQVVDCSATAARNETDSRKCAPAAESFSEEENIARSIIKNLEAGPFKSSDCKKIVVKNFPTHELAKKDSASFGTHFSRDIFPILEKYGVKLPNPNKKPRKYEMTEEARKKVV